MKSRSIMAVAALAATGLFVSGGVAQADVSNEGRDDQLTVTGEPSVLEVGEAADFTATVTPIGQRPDCQSQIAELRVSNGLNVSVNPGQPVKVDTQCTPVDFTITGDVVGNTTVEVLWTRDRFSTVKVTFPVEVIPAAPVDTTPPVVTITNPADGVVYTESEAAGDFEPVFTCEDPESGVTQANCVQSGFSTALGEHTMSVTGTNGVGLSTTESVTYQVVPDPDVTPPVVSIVAPADGATYDEGAVPAPDFTCTDAESVVTDCSQVGYSAAVGEHTMTVTGTSEGGTTTASSTYTVEAVGPAYEFSGYYRPVDMGVVNVIKGGKTVPLKFNLLADGGEVTDPSLISFSVTNSNQCDGSLSTDAVEETVAGGTSLRYDAEEGQFVQNWKTPKKGGRCYLATVSADGASISAVFSTK